MRKENEKMKLEMLQLFEFSLRVFRLLSQQGMATTCVLTGKAACSVLHRDGYFSPQTNEHSTRLVQFSGNETNTLYIN